LILEFLIDELKLLCIHQVEAFNEPETVAPSMIILPVRVENLRKEVSLLLEVFLIEFHDAASMMPDLEVLL